MKKTVFDSIASSWNQRRQTPSKTLGAIPMPAPSKNLVVMDAGCANARNTPALAKNAKKVFAVDNSKQMLSLARKNAAGCKNIVFKQADIRRLPFENDFFDSIYCLATIHLIPSASGRLKAMREFRRVLKPSGLLALTAWNFRQPRFSSLKQTEQMNFPINWTAGGKKVRRVYHFFEKTELVSLAKQAGFKKIKCFYEKKGARHQKTGAANLILTAVK